MIVLSRAELVDVPLSWPVVDSTVLAHGVITDFVQDEVRAPDGTLIKREYVKHPGAVAVIALDDQERVALVRQYRHPVRHRLIEPPAGLLDVQGENYLVGVQRELAEEVHLAAGRWDVLVDLFSTPGILGESIRIYLARELTATNPPDGFAREGEEADMDTVWAPLSDLVEAVLSGQLHSPSLVSGVLAADASRRRGWASLRPADSPWPARETLVAASLD
ncbi:MAG: NUDIX domain-containing protein [Friedmanniella sp.]